MAGFRLHFQAPVDVLARDRRIPDGPVVEGPEVGLCWGKASDFEWGLPPETAPNGTPALLIRQVEDVLFKGVESYREFTEEGPASLVVEGIRNATFYLGPRVEETEERRISGTTTVIQPIVTTVHEYVEFAFDLVTEGTRGETPPVQDEAPRRAAKIVAATDMSPFRTIVRLDTGVLLVRWYIDVSWDYWNKSATRLTAEERDAEYDQWVADGLPGPDQWLVKSEGPHPTLGYAYYVTQRFRATDLTNGLEPRQAPDWTPPELSDLEAYRDLLHPNSDLFFVFPPNTHDPFNVPWNTSVDAVYHLS